MQRCRAAWTSMRKALGAHEIDPVRTTAIDGEAGLIRLTTTLFLFRQASFRPSGRLPDQRDGSQAHGRGTHLRSPLCPLHPGQGIAGEDDLDAPDLVEGAQAGAACRSR